MVNAFTELLREKSKYGCERLACGTCGGLFARLKVIDQTFSTHLEHSPQRIIDSLSLLAPGQLQALPYWDTAVEAVLGHIYQTNVRERWNLLYGAWLPSLVEGDKSFLEVVGGYVLSASCSASPETARAWEDGLRKVADEFNDDSFVISLLRRLRASDPPRETFLRYAVERAKEREDKGIIKELLRVTVEGTDAGRSITEQALRVVIGRWDTQFAFNLLKNCAPGDESFEGIVKALMNMALERPSGELALRLAKALPKDHRSYSRALNFAVARAAEDADAELALSLSKQFGVRSREGARMLQLAVEEASREGDADLINNVLNAAGPHHPGQQRLLSKLLQLAREGRNPAAVRSLLVHIDEEHKMFDEALDLAEASSLDHPLVIERQRLRRREAKREEGLARSREQRERQSKRSAARVADLSIMDGHTAAERIEFMCEHDKPASYFPVEWALLSDHEVSMLSKETLSRLSIKLERSPRGAWRTLKKKIRELEQL